mgnify:CR=1 FL=1
MDIRQISKRFSFIKNMKPENREYLLDRLRMKKIPKGFIMVGDQGDCKGVPLVAKGILRLFKVSDNGREMTVYRVSEGEMCVLAAVCILGNLEYRFSVEAETDCIIADMSPETFMYLLERDTGFKAFVFGTLADKLIRSLNTVEMVTFKGIQERLEEYLENHADEEGRVFATHEKIAVELGSSREVISRRLKMMVDEGLIVQKRGCIVLKNRSEK